MSFRSITDVYSYLQGIPKFQSEGKNAADFTLHKFRKFCEQIENPQQKFPAIHVAGTNGKGSTCRLLASVYQTAGYKVGLYTSPHLIDLRERFVINGEEVADDVLVEFFESCEPAIREFGLTYFEITTAIAFWWFAKQEVDIAIIETGLGGRLDATNIINPKISVITSIALDHTDILGTTVTKIALEKAGIIKAHIPVVTGNIGAKSMQVIRSVALEKGSELYPIDSLSPRYNAGVYTIVDEGKSIAFTPGFFAPVQALNIAIAWQVVQVLEHIFPVTFQNILEGINKASILYANRARFERLSEKWQWYFDGAHNIEAIRAMKSMAEAIKPVHDAILICSMMKDKLSKDVIKEFSEFNKIFYHTTESNRAASFDEIKKYLPRVQPMPAGKEHQKKLLEDFKSELVIFAGSFYFYATVMDLLASFDLSR